MSTSPLTIFLATGGTGGHIFPAQALAEILIARGHKPILITDKRFDDRYKKGAFADIPIYTIPCASLSGGLIGKLKGAVRLGLGIIRSGYLLAHLKPDAVVGFGGYPSFPPLLMATQFGVPSIIHEQNALLGRVNRFLSTKISALATGFPEVKGIPTSARSRTYPTGNPVRANVQALRSMTYMPPRDTGKIHILITGGSLGATVFGEVVPKAIAALPDALRARLVITQQCRKDDEAEITGYYAGLGISATVAPFFVDLPRHMETAQLVIARAGASTVTELAVAGRPSILVPYPHAMDDHQTENARALAAAGGAWVIPQPEFTSNALTALLESLFREPVRLEKAAKAAYQVGQPEAAKNLADLVEQSCKK
ncbi:MAG: murG [Rickettsiales bacterium]|jgi:UDP-N-acetylglucosamine--N-acetylmuramyl-(pentapeptide) pyrophosphoryl-undecaprenol N-acetylglucosamine transferase|nr:murG [Rickettsiales bacterium]